jgi:opacity protein-like surface antigen
MNNRFFSLTAGVIVFLSASVSAQVHVRAGAVAGLSMFNEKTSGTTALVYDMKMGVTAGVVLDVAFANMLLFETGAGYSQRGGQIEDAGSLKSHKLSYLAIPIHGKFKYALLPVLSPFITAGLNVGLLLSAQELKNGEYIDIKPSYSANDYGLEGGAGLEFNLTSSTPYIEFLYYIGIPNIEKNPIGDNTIKNTGMEVKAGVKFKL